MMLLLVGYVPADRGPCRWADGKRGIPLLPRKTSQPDFLVNPHRRRLLDLPHHIRQTMRCLQTNERMDVLPNSAHAFGKAAQATKGAAQVIVQSSSPTWADERFTVLRAKYNVVMETQIGRRHEVERAGTGGRGALGVRFDVSAFANIAFFLDDSVGRRQPILQGFCKIASGNCRPARAGFIVLSSSGGVAPLDPRLMAGIPPG